ncbi:MAG TPA: ATP-binding protein, partial [Candidatus Nanopelagicales bacterium]|nr:ATP-binding protein [Candidatus Nanopelagicales bacterium]
REILDSATGLAANELRRRARIIRDYGHTPPAQGNRSRLGQVFLNLLLNAVDAVPEGRPDEHEIRIRTLTDELGRVIVEVSDTGAGIAAAHLGRVFDPFFTTKSPGKGTGLGLSICHHIITALGGEITVHSIEGEGTTFRVALAASTETLRDAAGRPYQSTGRSRPPRLAGRLSGNRVRVMIVDDEPALVRSLEIILGRHFHVVVAASSTAALHLLQRLEVDVILCDLMMAGMTGMELSETLGAVRPELQSRMVFMTGGAYTDEAHAFLANAQHRCLQKPFSERDVLGVVSQVAAGPRSARAHGAPPQPLEPTGLLAEE